MNDTSHGTDLGHELGRLRILMVTARYVPDVGGTEIHTYELAKRLASAGHEVTVLTTDLSGKLPPLEYTEGVNVARVPAWPVRSDYYFAPEIYRRIMRGHWDLIHCQGYHTLVAPLTMLAAYRMGIPYIVTFHSGGHPSRLRHALRWAQHWALRPLLAGAHRLVGVSNFETNFFQRRLRLARERFVTISNGSYLPRVDPVPDPKNGTLIVSVGRLERYKGHQRIISALPEVARYHPDVQLRIMGSGPYKSALWQLARECGVADRVQIGPVAINDRANMANTLAEAKLAILLSDYEAQGIAILEALSLGIPALVTHTTGLAELANGGLVRSVPLNSSPGTIATAMLQQLHQPLIVPDIHLPTWDRCAAHHLYLYQEVYSQHIGQQCGEKQTARNGAAGNPKEPSQKGEEPVFYWWSGRWWAGRWRSGRWRSGRKPDASRRGEADHAAALLRLVALDSEHAPYPNSSPENSKRTGSP